MASDAPDPLPPGLAWLAELPRTVGRPLRVLHIGNIANNAYNNAKIQRRVGIAADVIAADYYHVMGCPEWEDADFEGDVGDPMFPDWWGVDLNGFRRPRWFAQGSFHTSTRYLLAYRDRRAVAAALLWRRLQLERWLRCRVSIPAVVLAALLGVVRGGRERTIDWSGGSRTLRRALAYAVQRAAVAARAPGRFVNTTLRRLRQARRGLVALLRGASWREAAAIAAPRFAHALGHPRWAPPAWLPPAPPPELGGAETAACAAEQGGGALDPSRALVERFCAAFPERDPLAWEDYAHYLSVLDDWQRLFARYDIVQAYSTDAAIPLLCGLRRYAAYEHGTLREIPFEDTARGRLCALSYREAPFVFVTNSDVLPQTRALGLRAERVVYLPHAVDSDRLERFVASHGASRRGAAEAVTFFSPTRHDWVDGDPSWAKGNDRLIHALALVRDLGLEFSVVLTEWGRDLDATRALVEEHGLTARVEWVEPARKRELWLRYLGCHAVVDQFVTPAIGGVTFEAMALGCRVLTSLDIDTTSVFFGEAPPVLACSTPEAIAAALEQVVRDPGDAAGVGAAAREWFRRHHSAERVLDLQGRAYAQLVSEEPLAGANGAVAPRTLARVRLRGVATRARARGSEGRRSRDLATPDSPRRP